MNTFKSMFLGLLALCLSPALSLAAECPAIVDQALAAADTLCAPIGRNQACYGNVQAQAEPQPGAKDFRFEQAGDIVNVAALQSLELEPMNTEAGTWGVAVMSLQANIPDTLPGQNVTFLLFGDVEIINAVVPTDTVLRPMQAFYLRTGIGEPGCEEAPESGLIVQTPQGVGEITLRVNEVNVAMGSTVLFRAQPEHEQMEVLTLEGAALVEADGEVQPAVAGTGVHVPIIFDEQQAFEIQPTATSTIPTPTPDIMNTPSGGGEVSEPPSLGIAIPMRRDRGPGGPPLPPESYHLDELRGLPLDLLPRRIEVAAPLDGAVLEALHQRVEDGLPLCDTDLLPACDQLPDDFQRPRLFDPPLR